MNEEELHRQAKHRLAILRHRDEVSGNVAATCRYYGISRTRFYRWQRRYQKQGLAGLRDKSRRPHHSPTATSSEVVGKVVHLRQTYHFGPLKISMYLKRYHDIKISQSGVWRILKRLDMNRLPHNQRYKPHAKKWKRYEKQQPGHRVQVDVKFITPLEGSKKPRYYQLTAIDDCTGVRVLRIYERNNQKPPSSSSTTCARSSRSASMSSKPTTDPSSAPSSTGTSSTEESNTSTSNPPPHDSTEKSKDPTVSTPKSSTDSSTANSSTTPTCFNNRLAEWENYYNFDRPHGSLDGQTPYERLRQTTTQPTETPL